MEPTSEQELKQLLDEGKITEQEYQELLEAMKPKQCNDNQVGWLCKDTRITVMFKAIAFTFLTFMQFKVFYFMQITLFDADSLSSSAEMGTGRILAYSTGVVLAGVVIVGYMALYFWVALWEFDVVAYNSWSNIERRFRVLAFVYMSAGVALPMIFYIVNKYIAMPLNILPATVLFAGGVLELNAALCWLASRIFLRKKCRCLQLNS